ncbi:MAG: hypothetical protein KAS64_05715 [Spirochaetes bacterium]|nr:hypothetical protein [Spirochaetota bacterium]
MEKYCQIPKRGRRVLSRFVISGLLQVILLLLLFSSAFAKGNVVRVIRDARGWKLQVDGRDYFIKGVVWDPKPMGQYFMYNRYNQPDKKVMKQLDYEMALLKKAGINTIRHFGEAPPPPKWIKYMYEKWGIMHIIQHYCGSYGAFVDGYWQNPTLYDNKRTRINIINQIKAMVRRYKDVPGLLIYNIGNENNFRLFWKGGDIQDMPFDKQRPAKAKHLYSLIGEVVRECKKIDRNHPYMYVNGDILFAETLAKYAPNIDIYGANVYRGPTFYDAKKKKTIFRQVREILNKPIVFTEFGCDRYDSYNRKPMERVQSEMIRSQWRHILLNSHGKGNQGSNCLGGFQFEWRDEWWKYLLEEFLYDHQTVSSWGKIWGGWAPDWRTNLNNMTEEWWGITAQGYPGTDGITKTYPKTAYYVLQEIFKINPYNLTAAQIRRRIDGISIEDKVQKSAVEDWLRYRSKFSPDTMDALSLTGGEMRGEWVMTGWDDGLFNKRLADFSHGEMVFLNFHFKPFKNLFGDFKLNIMGGIPRKLTGPDYESFNRGQQVVLITKITNGVYRPVVQDYVEISDKERIEIYSLNATFETVDFSINVFHHVPRFHWGYEGDWYGLYLESTDMGGMDIWHTKAPSGIEFDGKLGIIKGWKILLGNEIYWGANPQVMVKYHYTSDGYIAKDFVENNFNKFEFAFVHKEEFREIQSVYPINPVDWATRVTTLYFQWIPITGFKLEFGGIMSGTEKIGKGFRYTEKSSGTGYLNTNLDVIQDYVRLSDTLGGRLKADFKLNTFFHFDFQFMYSGIVADGGNPFLNFGRSYMPFSRYGNKIVYEGGITLNFNAGMRLRPRVMIRKNLVDALPNIEAALYEPFMYPGTKARNRIDDPFAVMENRAANSYEIAFEYDPSGGTWFFNWDNDRRETSPVAYNIVFNYTEYTTATDGYTFWYDEGGKTLGLPNGFPRDSVFKLAGKLVLNPSPVLKIITRLEIAKQQAWHFGGDTPKHEFFDFNEPYRAYRAVSYQALKLDVWLHSKFMFLLEVIKDGWGPYDWMKEWNFTYPWQIKFDFSIMLDGLLNRRRSNKIGFLYEYRNLDEYSVPEEWLDGKNHHMHEVSVYYRFVF